MGHRRLTHPPTTPAPGEFAHVNAWIFDLDNTLYPPALNLFAEVDTRITQWIANYYGIDGLGARALQKHYFLKHGTSLNGMMVEDGVEPDDFLAFVHDIDHAKLEPDHRLADAIAALPGDKYILTNGSRGHAEGVAKKLGIDHLFADMFGIEAALFTPKPRPRAYEIFLDKYGIDPARAAMFEDMHRNLEVPHTLGMKTVLVLGEGPLTGDTRAAWETEAAPQTYIDHISWDLPHFLAQLV